ncbi:MAG: dihydropteroate synthase, partial [Streptococcaceae bacterium]|nr:dihydropteroate synthase [Streptococcaceae bacterium]
KKLLQAGVRIIGGCCGTTPEFIQKLRQVIDTLSLVETKPRRITAVTSGLETVEINNLTLIGERINPTGKPKLKAALRQHDLDYLLREAILQKEAGADILDVNVGLPEIDESQMMIDAVVNIQGLVSVPLQIDSSDIAALEAGARYYNGVPLINSVNGKAESLREVLPIVAKYGGVVLGLCLDSEGIPLTAKGRLEIAERIVNAAKDHDIPRERVMIDPLVLTASAQQAQVQVTLDTLRLIKTQLGCKTAVGLSNVSFGLPNRELINASFLAAATGAGLDAPIMNPLSETMQQVVYSLRIFSMQDVDSVAYIKSQQDKNLATSEPKETEILDLKAMIIKGRKELTAKETKRLLASLTPLEIVENFFIPALDTVGQLFETGELFLPQLMRSAEATQQAQDVLKEQLELTGEQKTSRGRILLCTVEGDIHDIGKNIVKMILENYGFEVLDLGKDVPINQVVEVAIAENIRLIGLSALMTTTVQNMKKTIEAFKDRGYEASFMVGGAVLNEEYREFVGADYYAKDAMASVEIAQAFFKKDRE